MSQGNAPMELCELNLDDGNGGPVPHHSSDAIAKIQAQVEQLSAFMKGSQRAGQGKGAPRGPWQQYSGTGGAVFRGSKGQEAPGKGKGKGKGLSPVGIASCRAQLHGSQALCPTEARTGKCDFQERAGRACKFLHVRVPKELSGVEGLIRSDLGEVKWSEHENCYLCMDELDSAVLPDFIAHVADEVQQITAQLSEEEAESSF